MSNSLAIIGGNEVCPELFLVGYRAAFKQFNHHDEAQWILFNFFSVDYEFARLAMRRKAEGNIQRLINGYLSESDRLEFTFTVFIAPETYYWSQRLGVYPQHGQLISPVESVKYYVYRHLLPKQSTVQIGVIGSNEAIRLYTKLPDHSRETQKLNYAFYGPNAQIVADLTAMRHAERPPDPQQASIICQEAIEDILTNHPVDIILLADLQTESWFKEQQTYLSRLEDVESLQNITTTFSYHGRERDVIILSATQALIHYAAYLTSLPMIPDSK